MSYRRKFAGIELRKTIGVNHHRWVTELARQPVKFTPYLGRYNNKPFRWYASALRPGGPLDHDMHGSTFHVEDNSLSECVRLAQIEAHKRMRAIYMNDREVNHV